MCQGKVGIGVGLCMDNMIITIDGPAGSGKSTVSVRLAKRLGFAFLDTGAMYRAITWAGMEQGAELNNTEAMISVINRSDFGFENVGGETLVTCNSQDISDVIRSPEVTEKVKAIASNPALRDILVEMQRDFARKHGSIVTEGRDQGTVVFPDAAVKFFLEAGVDQRSERRYRQLKEMGVECDIDQIRKAIEQRDLSDQSRSAGPLKPAADAILVDTSEMTVEDVIEFMMTHIDRLFNKNSP